MFKKGSVKGALPGCVKLTPVQQGTYTCLGSRDRIAAPVREVGESRVGTASLSFSLTSCRCYVAVESICNVLTVVI